MTIGFVLSIVGCAGAVLIGVSQIGKGIVEGITEIKNRKNAGGEDVDKEA